MKKRHLDDKVCHASNYVLHWLVLIGMTWGDKLSQFIRSCGLVQC